MYSGPGESWLMRHMCSAAKIARGSHVKKALAVASIVAKVNVITNQLEGLPDVNPVP